MKAYKVSCRDDDHGCSIVFAESPNEARKRGNGDWCDCGYMNLRATREPSLDQYSASGKVPFRTLVEKHGWFMFCGSCETPVYADTPGMLWDGETVYCSEFCHERHLSPATGPSDANASQGVSNG